LKKYISSSDNAKVLEIGFGTGITTKEILKTLKK
jgi:16S rRNA A1518/A1519 N6-dimethyltransferase RsmA/KsgA/DIM1 with predicted DNA glycosylase/AP lyase activity